MILKNISSGGIFKEVSVKGTRHRDIGLQVTVPKGEYVFIDTFRARDVFIPLIKYGEGLLEIRNFDAALCGGDAYNFRASHVHIENYIARDWRPTRQYRSYHTDIGGQIYAVKKDRHTVDPDGMIEDIIIENFHIESENPMVQGFMASEACRYKNIRLGTKSLYCDLKYGYPIVFNTAEDCIIGNKDNVHYTGRVKIANVKDSQWTSRNNQILL